VIEVAGEKKKASLNVREGPACADIFKWAFFQQKGSLHNEERKTMKEGSMRNAAEGITPRRRVPAFFSGGEWGGGLGGGVTQRVLCMGGKHSREKGKIPAPEGRRPQRANAMSVGGWRKPQDTVLGKKIKKKIKKR